MKTWLFKGTEIGVIEHEKGIVMMVTNRYGKIELIVKFSKHRGVAHVSVSKYGEYTFDLLETNVKRLSNLFKNIDEIISVHGLEAINVLLREILKPVASYEGLENEHGG